VFCLKVINELDFSKKCIIFYIIIILKKIEMIKIYCGEFDHGILLLVKICTINLLIKNYIQAVRLRNIVAGKNLHN
jgi:hypothetical protein